MIIRRCDLVIINIFGVLILRCNKSIIAITLLKLRLLRSYLIIIPAWIKNIRIIFFS